MKKLMFAAAAALCATVGFAEGGISSANVVGYQDNALAKGYTMITPTFVNVSGGELDIDKMLIIKGATADQQCSINVMDEDGKWIGTYYWMLEMWVGQDYYPAGWCDASYNPSGVVLDPGEAVYFYTGRTGLSMTIKSPLEKADD